MLKPITDLQNMGQQKFESASLTTFNKKIQDLKAGRLVEGKMDDIATPNFQITATDNSDWVVYLNLPRLQWSDSFSVHKSGSVRFFAPKMGNCELQPV